MPPTKCSIEGPKAIYNVYSFPHSQPEVIKKEFSEQIERLTTNILDKAIVE